MKIEQQYKAEVQALVLSESFKQSLKDNMAKEFALVASENISKPWMKYSKYIATAACLLLIVATISVVSMMGNSFEVQKSANESMPQNDMMLYDTESDDSAIIEEGTAITNDNDIAGGEVTSPAATTEEEDDAIIEVEEEEVVEDVIVEEDVLEDAVEEEAAAEESELVEETAPALEEAAPLLRSAYAPEDYDGEFFAEDYVIGNDTSPSYEAESLTELESEEGEYESYSDLSLNELRYLDSVNFVKFTIDEEYSAEDAIALTGDDSFATDKSLYKAHVTYDYLNGADLDLSVYLVYPGTIDNQIEGRPILESGEKYVSCLTFENGLAEMLFELSYAVHRINGIDIAYHLTGASEIDPGDTHMGMLDLEREVITSTLNNPAKYTHKAAVKELYRYLRRNWTREEYPFTDFANLGGGTSSEDGEQIITGEALSSIELALDASEVSVEINGAEFDPKGHSTNIYSQISSLSNGSGSNSEGSYLSFIGGKISFDAGSPLSGNITEISLGAESKLPITINGIGIGSSLSDLIDAFSLNINVLDTFTLNAVTETDAGVPYSIVIEAVGDVITSIIIK